MTICRYFINFYYDVYKIHTQLNTYSTFSIHKGVLIVVLFLLVFQ